MSGQKFCRHERRAAGGAEPSGNGHPLGHGGIDYFGIDGSTATIGDSMALAVRIGVEIEMTAERSSAGPNLVAVGIKMVGLEPFSQFEVNFAGMFLHQLFPAHAPGDGGGADISVIALGFEAQNFPVLSDIGTDKI